MVFLVILQLLIDVLLVGLGVAYLIQRKRLLRLEADLHRALMDLDEKNHLGSERSFESSIEKLSLTSSLNTPLGSATSTLTERQNEDDSRDYDHKNQSTSTSLSIPARYGLAQKLFKEGMSLAEVARKSGMSETELALLKKFTQSPKNYEAH
jgi:hypothetical protein